MSKLTFIIYLILFAALLLHPHLIEHIGPISKPYVESILNVVIIGLGLLTYYLHQRRLARQEKALNISKAKLLESFKYIGLVNRQLPLLRQVSTDLMANNNGAKQGKKTVFDNLLAIAVVSIAKKKWGVLRFIAVDSYQTVKEFIHTHNKALVASRISNRELVVASGQSNFATAQDFYSIHTSDQAAVVKAYLIFPRGSGAEDLANEYSVLQAITDQAQLFFKYLYV
ncbi:MAG: hypothetical protein HYT31_04165 [Parcubacteria group bacterium]|nr:hypothetical protein [Parcubacteria group bacterium]